MKLAMISKKMKHEPFTFIVGDQRSGTTMLYRTLQKHSAFRPKNINLVEVRMWTYSCRSYLLKDEFDHPTEQEFHPLTYMLKNQSVYKEFLASIAKIRLMHRLLYSPILYFSIKNQKILNLLNLRPWWWYINLNHLVLRSYFYFAKKSRGSDMILGKTPGSTKYIPHLTLAFPQCKSLYICRHPVDVYTSFVRRGRIQTDQEWLKLPPNRFCEKYKVEIELALRYSTKRKQSFLLIRYEDFTQDTENEFKKICNFLGIPFEKEALIEGAPSLWQSKADPHMTRKITPKTKDWKDYISFEGAQYIENELTTIMKMLNYQRYTNSHT